MDDRMALVATSDARLTGADAGWRVVALGNEIAAGKVGGFFIDDDPVAVFRTPQGEVRALENRCPHRRVPLSLGKVLPEGWLQCGYHGWTFDGVTGQCKVIPNLSAHEKTPAGYAALAYRALERDGVIYVGQGAQESEPPRPLYASPGKVFSGRSMIGLSQDDYVAALMDGPHLLLDCTGMRIAETMIADPHDSDGWMVMERAAFWMGQTSFDGFVQEYKLIFRLALRPDTGEVWASFLRPDGEAVAAGYLAVTQATRGVTAIVWRSFVLPAEGLRPGLLGLAAVFGQAPISPRADIDMNALSKLLVGPSINLQQDLQASGLNGQTQERAIS
jgi:nitrite reductase/ring-hydroxylating ferredoxin subunit